MHIRLWLATLMMTGTVLSWTNGQCADKGKADGMAKIELGTKNPIGPQKGVIDNPRIRREWSRSSSRGRLVFEDSNGRQLKQLRLHDWEKSNGISSIHGAWGSASVLRRGTVYGKGEYALYIENIEGSEEGGTTRSLKSLVQYLGADGRVLWELRNRTWEGYHAVSADGRTILIIEEEFDSNTFEPDGGSIHHTCIPVVYSQDGKVLMKVGRYIDVNSPWVTPNGRYGRFSFIKRSPSSKVYGYVNGELFFDVMRKRLHEYIFPPDVSGVGRITSTGDCVVESAGKLLHRYRFD